MSFMTIWRVILQIIDYNSRACVVLIYVKLLTSKQQLIITLVSISIYSSKSIRVAKY